MALPRRGILYAAGGVAGEPTFMPLEDTFRNLSEFLNGLDEEGQTRFEMSHSMVIICPDDGKNIAFRNRCPKCGGNSWIPAGHAGGIFEKMKAERMRRQMRAPDQEFEEEMSRPAPELQPNDSLPSNDR